MIILIINKSLTLKIKIAVICCFTAFLFSCAHKATLHQSKKNQGSVEGKSDIEMWLTEADKSALFAKQETPLFFSDQQNQFPTIEVNPEQKFQQIDGFGFCLTDGSAYLINQMDEGNKSKLLHELFSTDGNSIGISYIQDKHWCFRFKQPCLFL